MTIEQTIGILGQIATWITVMLVFLTLREMEKQRKASQEPELIIQNADIYGYPEEKIPLNIAFYWSSKSEKLDVEIEYTPPCAILQNIGSGAAKEIEIYWNFDIQNTVNSIEEYFSHTSIPIHVEIQDNQLLYKIGEGYDGMPIVSNFNYTYVLPSSINSEGLKAIIPTYFQLFLSCFIYISLQNNEYKKLNIPPLQCEVEYKDVVGVKFKKIFTANFSLVYLSSSTQDSNTQVLKPIYHGVLEFKETSTKKKKNIWLSNKFAELSKFFSTRKILY